MLKTTNHLQTTGQCNWKRQKSASTGEQWNWQKQKARADKLFTFLDSQDCSQMKQQSEKSNRKIRLWVEDSKPHFGYFCEESIFNSWRTSAKSKQQLNKWHSYATFSPLGEKPVFPSSSIWDITVLVFFNTLRDLRHLTDYLCSKTQSFTDTILNFCLAT